MPDITHRPAVNHRAVDCGRGQDAQLDPEAGQVTCRNSSFSELELEAPQYWWVLLMCWHAFVAGAEGFDHLCTLCTSSSDCGLGCSPQ